MRIHAEHSITAGIRPLLTVDAKACRKISQNILKILPPFTPYPHRHPDLFCSFASSPKIFLLLLRCMVLFSVLLAFRLFALVHCLSLSVVYVLALVYMRLTFLFLSFSLFAAQYKYDVISNGFIERRRSILYYYCH